MGAWSGNLMMFLVVYMLGNGIPLAREKNAWWRLDKKIVETLSRHVVSLVSFNGNGTRFFSCTGFLVRFPLKNKFTRSILLTLASLVRTCEATDTVDDNMRVGIGGPLINLSDGSLFGMNFYDGKNGRTPFLPYKQICEVLQLLGLELERRKKSDVVRRLDGPDDRNNQNRWPVPQPFWYHGLLEADRFDPIPMRGRILQ